MITNKAILLDLDDTLLGNSMDTFLPGFFHYWSEHVAPVIDSEKFIDAQIEAIDLVVAQPDPLHSNLERFWVNFEERSGLSASEYKPLFEVFYRDVYPRLESLTQRRETAKPLVEYCFSQGWQVVIATNPLFLCSAIEQRLAWAGLPVEEYDFALVTCLENMHATKPHVAYYEEILQKIGVSLANAVMVGDSWENDIEPTYKMGMPNFWIQLESGTPPDPQIATNWGSLSYFNNLLREGKIF